MRPAITIVLVCITMNLVSTRGPLKITTDLLNSTRIILLPTSIVVTLPYNWAIMKALSEITATQLKSIRTTRWPTIIEQTHTQVWVNTIAP